MNRLPSVLRNEIWEYVHGDRKYWKEQMSKTIKWQLKRRGPYFPDVNLKQVFIDSAIADDSKDDICPFCGRGDMSEANGNGYWACEHCDQIASYCKKCHGWMNYVDYADEDDDEKMENIKRRMPRSSSTKLVTADRIGMETTAILCWKCEKCNHVKLTSHW